MATLKVGSLGDYIRDQRKSAQYSLRQLAAAAGVSNPYLSQIERGLKKPSAEILQQIAKALRISAETLYVHAGFLEDRGSSSDVVAAILSDPAIGDRHKRVLIDIYESFRSGTVPDVVVGTTAHQTFDGQAHDRQAHDRQALDRPTHHRPYDQAHHSQEEDRMTITKSKPFYAVAGAGDLAVKALREVPNKLSQLRVDPKDIASTITVVQDRGEDDPLPRAERRRRARR